MSDSLLKLERFIFKPDWTISRLYVGDVHKGYVVEDEIREVKVHGDTAIPYGTYPLGIRQSPKFSKAFYWNEQRKKLISQKEFLSGAFGKGYVPHDLIWVLDVPNFQYILLHWGNTDDDTEGCLVVGSAIGMIGKQEGVLHSRIAYQEIYPQVYPLIKAGSQKIDIVKLTEV